MANTKKHTNPVPPENQPKGGPAQTPGALGTDGEQTPPNGAPFEDQDEKRRLGNYGTAGEAPIKQPGGKNDANH